MRESTAAFLLLDRQLASLHLAARLEAVDIGTRRDRAQFEHRIVRARAHHAAAPAEHRITRDGK